MEFSTINQWTYEFNQQNKDDRHSLVDAIKRNGNLDQNHAEYAALYACYLISFIFDIWFKNKEKDGISIDFLFEYLYDNNFFRARDSYQLYSSADILADMCKNDIIDNYNFLDVDYRNIGRKAVYDILVSEMAKKDFTCARVCFGADAQSDHALIVAVDDQGNNVVCDTSYREHTWPNNDMDKYITPHTIRWFTMIE